MKIAILMSTYNGEKYLNEQLESIFMQQVNAEITVYIRDDGSKDKTVAKDTQRCRCGSIFKEIVELFRTDRSMCC